MDTEQGQLIQEQPQQQPFLDSLSQKVNLKKQQKTLQEIQSLEKMWMAWLSQQQITSQHSSEPIKKEDETIKPNICEQQTSDKNTQLQKFFLNLKKSMLEEGLYKTITQAQLTQFFEEASTQISNKIKLYEDIQKLKLLQNYPSSTKRTYSKQANMILKKWLIENYNHPYPKPSQVDQLVIDTQLTNKQVLNWFINARNSLKNKSIQEKKFKLIVEHKFKELSLCKKIKFENHY